MLDQPLLRQAAAPQQELPTCMSGLSPDHCALAPATRLSPSFLMAPRFSLSPEFTTSPLYTCMGIEEEHGQSPDRGSPCALRTRSPSAHLLQESSLPGTVLPDPASPAPLPPCSPPAYTPPRGPPLTPSPGTHLLQERRQRVRPGRASRCSAPLRHIGKLARHPLQGAHHRPLLRAHHAPGRRLCAAAAAGEEG